MELKLQAISYIQLRGKSTCTQFHILFYCELLTTAENNSMTHFELPLPHLAIATGIRTVICVQKACGYVSEYRFSNDTSFSCYYFKLTAQIFTILGLEIGQG